MKKFVFVLALLLALMIPAASVASAASITVYNWYDYIDESVLDMFTKETGIEVKYVNFSDNEEMYAKLTSGAGVYDVIFPSDYIIERLIKDDMLEKLDVESMPNLKNIIGWMQKPDYDPTGEYSVAYMWGTVGILYNSTMVDEEITSWKQLFDGKYRRSVCMMRSIRDSIGVTLKMLGYSVNSRDPEALKAAEAALIQQKNDGIVKGYFMDETKDKMIAGEAAMAVMYSGDAMYSIQENEDLRYVVPEEGSNVWLDGMCIPKGTANKEAAEAFIDFLCRPDIARMNMDYIWYSTPVQTVVDEMSEEEKADLTLNPSEEILARCEFFHDIEKDIGLYKDIWTHIFA